MVPLPSLPVASPRASPVVSLVATPHHGAHPFFRAPVAAGGAARGGGSPGPSISGRTGLQKGKNPTEKLEGFLGNVFGVRMKGGQVALVDEGDVEKVKGYTWHVDKKGYARTSLRREHGSRGVLMMHRLILGLKTGYPVQVDHKNGNKLDNRQENLRVATQGENARNRGKSGQSGNHYKGVKWHKRNKRWEARVTLNGVRVTKSGFKTEEEAARAYDEMAKKYHGEFARLNFPE